MPSTTHLHKDHLSGFVSRELIHDNSYGLSLSSKYILIYFAKYYMEGHLKRVRCFIVHSIALMQTNKRTLNIFFCLGGLRHIALQLGLTPSQNQDFSSQAHVFTLKEWLWRKKSGSKRRKDCLLTIWLLWSSNIVKQSILNINFHFLAVIQPHSFMLMFSDIFQDQFTW